jgi:Reverse transcriptase (RNA-dependent DNA polymerase)
MINNGFKRGDMDHCYYFKRFNDSYIILLLYVDDMLIAGTSMKEINTLKRELAQEFEMDLGPAN